MNKILFTCLLLPLLSNCTSHYVFDTDVSTENTRQYFSASKVKIYQNEQSITAPHQYLGLIEGDDCQMKAHLAQPDIINARTQARQFAYKQGANAVVFTRCVDIETKYCVAQVVCYAKMYQIGGTTPKTSQANKNND